MDAVMMFNTLVLSALYKLPDDQIEYQLCDRLSFTYYPAGDCAAICREGGFWGWASGAGCQGDMAVPRCVGCHAGKVEELFGLFDGHLARQGYIARGKPTLRGGQILDGSIVPKPRNHNTREIGRKGKGTNSPRSRSAQNQSFSRKAPSHNPPPSGTTLAAGRPGRRRRGPLPPMRHASAPAASFPPPRAPGFPQSI